MNLGRCGRNLSRRDETRIDPITFQPIRSRSFERCLLTNMRTSPVTASEGSASGGDSPTPTIVRRPLLQGNTPGLAQFVRSMMASGTVSGLEGNGWGEQLRGDPEIAKCVCDLIEGVKTDEEVRAEHGYAVFLVGDPSCHLVHPAHWMSSLSLLPVLTDVPICIQS